MNMISTNTNQTLTEVDKGLLKYKYAKADRKTLRQENRGGQRGTNSVKP